MRIKFITYLFLAVLFLGSIWFLTQKPEESLKITENNFKIIKINNFSLEIELADTMEKRILGLSGRNSLPPNRGLLFVYEIPAFYEIWMKDMKFPIDIIWIDERGEIIDIKKDAKPESFPETFKPLTSAKYVLEVNTGFSDQAGLKIGNNIAFDF